MIDRMEELRAAAGVSSSPAPSPGIGGRLAASLLRSSPPPTPQNVTPPASARSSRSRASAAPDQELHSFLTKLDDIRRGPLHELETLLLEAKAVQDFALRATTAQREQEAVSRADALAERASASGLKTCQALQALADEAREDSGNPTQDALRRQSFAGVSVLFQNALNAHFQAQQAFRTEMEAKVNRQLRAAFPEADDAAVAAVAAGRRSAATAVQETLEMQSGTGPLQTAMALQTTREKINELEVIARAAQQLRQAFMDVESLVDSQGEIINDIATHVAATRDKTDAALQQLQHATDDQRRCRRRWIALASCFSIVILVLIIVFGSAGKLR